MAIVRHMARTGKGIAFVFFACAVFIWPCSPGFAQFTQGPPDNPSAAGITTGSPPPAPVPPHVVGQPPSSALPPAPGSIFLGGEPSTSAGAADIVSSPRWILSMAGLPPLLDSASASAFARYLGLTEDQARSMEEMRNRFFRETRGMRYEILQRRLEIRSLFSDPECDRSVLLAKERELSGLWQKFMNLSADMAYQARQILKPGQVERLDQLPAR